MDGLCRGRRVRGRAGAAHQRLVARRVLHQPAPRRLHGQPARLPVLQRPSRAAIFLGDCGSLFIGYLMGSLTLLERYVTHASSPLFPVLMPVLVLAVPLVDTATVVFIRLRSGGPSTSATAATSRTAWSRSASRPARAVLFLYLADLLPGPGRRPSPTPTRSSERARAAADRGFVAVCSAHVLSSGRRLSRRSDRSCWRSPPAAPAASDVILDRPPRSRPTADGPGASSHAARAGRRARADDALMLTCGRGPGAGHRPARSAAAAARPDLVPRDGRVALESPCDPAVPHRAEVVRRTRARDLRCAAAAGRLATSSALWTSRCSRRSSEPEPEPESPANPASPDATGAGAEDRPPVDGLQLGPLRPAARVEAVYVDADSTLSSTAAGPRPLLRGPPAARASALSARLPRSMPTTSRACAVPRASTSVRDTSHLVNAGLELPVGSRLTLRAHRPLRARPAGDDARWIRAASTSSGSGAFRRNQFGVRGRLQTAGAASAATWAPLRSGARSTTVPPSSTTTRRTVQAGWPTSWARALTAPGATATSAVPPSSERPLVESSARALALELVRGAGPARSTGELAPAVPATAPRRGRGRHALPGHRGRGRAAASDARPGGALQLARQPRQLPVRLRGRTPSTSRRWPAPTLDLPRAVAVVLRLAAGYHRNDYGRSRPSVRAAPRRIWEAGRSAWAARSRAGPACAPTTGGSAATPTWTPST